VRILSHRLEAITLLVMWWRKLGWQGLKRGQEAREVMAPIMNIIKLMSPVKLMEEMRWKIVCKDLRLLGERMVEHMVEHMVKHMVEHMVEPPALMRI